MRRALPLLLLVPTLSFAGDRAIGDPASVCRPPPGPGPATLPDWAFALPEGTLQVEVVKSRAPATRPGDGRWGPLLKRHPAVLRVTAETVSMQRFAEALTSATGLPIFVAPELQHVRVTQYHPAGRISDVLQQLTVGPVRIEVEPERVALQSSGARSGDVRVLSTVVLPAEPGTEALHLRDLWCSVAGATGDPAGVVDDTVVVTGELAQIERARALWTEVRAAGGGAGDRFACRWTPGTRPIPTAGPKAPGTLALEVVGTAAPTPGLFDAPDALLDISADQVPFGEFALLLGKALDRPAAIDPRLHTTRVTLRLTAASMVDLGDALAQRWSVHPGDDGHGNTLWDSWRPSHALGSWVLPQQEAKTVVMPIGDPITARGLAEASCEFLSDHGSLLSSGGALVVRDYGPPLARIQELVDRILDVTAQAPAPEPTTP